MAGGGAGRGGGRRRRGAGRQKAAAPVLPLPAGSRGGRLPCQPLLDEATAELGAGMATAAAARDDDLDDDPATTTAPKE
ncbi:Os07g0592866 [Oryza sativa Japonica Group]|nr:Os07g0592866 [Oryza sativa Japonica Group]